MNDSPRHRVIHWLKRVITSPRAELTHWQKTVRFGHDLGRYGARQLRRDRASLMAAALSFRTLFGLLPLLVVGTILVKAFGGLEQFEAVLAEFLGSLGLDHEVGENGREAVPAATQSVSQLILDVFGEAQGLNLAAIGWVGVFVLIYSAISLMVTIEGCFNSICRAPEGRPWTRRVPIYWTVVTLAPAAIAGTAYIDHRFDEFLADAFSWWLLLRIAPLLWSFLATWIVMFVVYKLLPNTRVQTNSALIGAFVAALLLEIGRRTLGVYLDNALSISHLYGSLGLIPLFMFWVYLMWLVILFGLEVTATLQMLSGRSLEEIEYRRRASGLVDPMSILAVMEVIARRFERSQPTGPRHIADETGLAEATVVTMLDGLVDARILHRLDGDGDAVTLARPPEGIEANELIEVGYGLVDDGSPSAASGLLRRLREAQRLQAAACSLTELLRPQPVAGGASQVPEAG